MQILGSLFCFMAENYSDKRIRLRQEDDGAGQLRAARGGSVRLGLTAVLALILFFLFWASLVFTVPYTQWELSASWVFESVKGRFQQLYGFLFGLNSRFESTFCQYLAAMLVGSALASTGAVFQGSFKNVLAGPSTMGVISGGSLGCLVYLLFFYPAETASGYYTADREALYSRSFFDIYGQQIFILLGCVLGVALVVAVATVAGRGRLSSSAMILSGTVFSALVGNISMVIQYSMILANPADQRIELVQELMMGSFAAVTNFPAILMLGIPILLCELLLLLIRNRLNALSLGEDEAAALGVNVQLYRKLMIAVGTVLTASVVSFCGHIGFLGFMIPLIGRKLAGPDMRRLLPVSMLLGAILMVLVFDLAYMCGMTDSMNLFTSCIGGLVMITVLLKKKGGAGP